MYQDRISQTPPSTQEYLETQLIEFERVEILQDAKDKKDENIKNEKNETLNKISLSVQPIKVDQSKGDKDLETIKKNNQIIIDQFVKYYQIKPSETTKTPAATLHDKYVNFCKLNKIKFFDSAIFGKTFKVCTGFKAYKSRRIFYHCKIDKPNGCSVIANSSSPLV